jgi:hypothetical protein
MSLIKRIQACGLCCCECQSISYKEAEAIKDLVLGEVVKAVKDRLLPTEESKIGKVTNGIYRDAIKAIQEIK